MGTCRRTGRSYQSNGCQIFSTAWIGRGDHVVDVGTRLLLGREPAVVRILRRHRTARRSSDPSADGDTVEAIDATPMPFAERRRDRGHRRCFQAASGGAGIAVVGVVAGPRPSWRRSSRAPAFEPEAETRCSPRPA